MRQITLKVKENKFQKFMELIEGLDFVEIEKIDQGDSKEEIINNLKKGIKEVNQFKNGNLKTTSAKAFLNEL